MSDAKTRDTGVSLNNNYVRSVATVALPFPVL